MGSRKIVWVGLVLAVGVVLAGCGGARAPAGITVRNPRAATPAGSWLYPNGDAGNTRDAAGAAISSANVAGLQQAWAFKLPPSLVTSGPGFGSLAAAPIVANGVVYLQDLGGNVYALALATGTCSATARARSASSRWPPAAASTWPAPSEPCPPAGS